MNVNSVLTGEDTSLICNHLCCTANHFALLWIKYVLLVEVGTDRILLILMPLLIQLIGLTLYQEVLTEQFID